MEEEGGGIGTGKKGEMGVDGETKFPHSLVILRCEGKLMKAGEKFPNSFSEDMEEKGVGDFSVSRSERGGRGKGVHDLRELLPIPLSSSNTQ